ncbi:MAG: phospholipase D family protein [Halioglobus sp.]
MRHAFTARHALFRAGSLLLCTLFLAACASVPFDYPRESSQAMPVSNETVLGEFALEWKKEHGSKAGFVGLPLGADALGLRLKMLERAEHSIDAQYFILKKDRAGVLFASGLLAAADRGVRVRLLIDDIFSPGVDEAFSLLASHPNIDVRLFNPLARQSVRYLGYLTDFKRANRRMHNKSLTVDNAMSIVGGRNIGEEYFEINQDVQFDDYEVMMVGDIVEEVSQGFDIFWSSDLAVPMEAFGLDVNPNELDRWRDYIRQEVSSSNDGLYATAINSPLLKDLREDRVEPVVAEASLVTDRPEKLQAALGDEDEMILIDEMARRFLAAREEILIVSPYYIPQEGGAKFTEELLAKGVRVIVVTNSLASTNHVPVHSGYARYRKRLLEAGAEFYEVKVDAVAGENLWGHQPEAVTLHSKATIIDGESIFIGSLNFDPRSIKINTEMGIFIESVEAGAGLRDQIFDGLARTTWRVDLDEKGKLRWTYSNGDDHQVVHKEPQSTWWRRFQVGFYRLLPIEGQL